MKNRAISGSAMSVRTSGKWCELSGKEKTTAGVFRKATTRFIRKTQLVLGPIIPPVIEHHHTECRSITGGYVYHGPKFPELQGAYFYGDYEYGQVWALRYDGQRVTWQDQLADTSLRIASFGVGRDGEIYLIDHPTGELYTLERAPEQIAGRPFPRKLSETGMFVFCL